MDRRAITHKPDPARFATNNRGRTMATLTLPCETGQVSDGYHTFDELYKHRYMLFAALMASNPEISWTSSLHADGSRMDGWLIAGMDLPTGTVTYHLPADYDSLLLDARVSVLERAPEWDGHTPDDVIERVKLWIKTKNSQLTNEA